MIKFNTAFILSQDRVKNKQLGRQIERTVEFIRNTCELLEFDETEIAHAIGVWSINSFGTNLSPNLVDSRYFLINLPKKFKAQSILIHQLICRAATVLFPKLCLAAHNCIPNTYGVLRIAESENFPHFAMDLYASMDIPKGSQIHTTYVDTLEGTYERETILWSNYFFHCDCKRCSDPTELGTYFSAIACTSCLKNFVLPHKNASGEILWVCENEDCEYKNGIHGDNFKSLLFQTKNEANRIPNEATLNAIQRLENVVKNCSQFYHRNHWILIKIEERLVETISAFLAKVEKTLGRFSKDEHGDLIQRVIDVSEHCLEIGDILLPGENMHRGNNGLRNFVMNE